MMDRDEYIEKLKGEIARMQKRVNALEAEKKPIVDCERLARIVRYNLTGCEYYISVLARHAVDDPNKKKVTKIGELTEKQRELARDVANEIITAMENAHEQQPWLDDSTELLEANNG